MPAFHSFFPPLIASAGLAARQDQANKRQSDGQIEEGKLFKGGGGETNRRTSLPSDVKWLRDKTEAEPQGEKRNWEKRYNTCVLQVSFSYFPDDRDKLMGLLDNQAFIGVFNMHSSVIIPGHRSSLLLAYDRKFKWRKEFLVWKQSGENYDLKKGSGA